MPARSAVLLEADELDCGSDSKSSLDRFKDEDMFDNSPRSNARVRKIDAHEGTKRYNVAVGICGEGAIYAAL